MNSPSIQPPHQDGKIPNPGADLSQALEDYLETVFLLVKEQGFARVRDIADARDVKAASVSPAMSRLARLGLIQYVRREYITLTPLGEQVARRIYARHQVMTRFFVEVLKVPRAVAQQDACAMEHSLSPRVMDAMARFLEFMELCPEGTVLLEQYGRCTRVNHCETDCCDSCSPDGSPAASPPVSVSDLRPGQVGVVTQVEGRGAIRQRLLDMGILPRVRISVERVAPAGDPIWIKLQGFQLSLRRKEASAVLVAPV